MEMHLLISKITPTKKVGKKMLDMILRFFSCSSVQVAQISLHRAKHNPALLTGLKSQQDPDGSSFSEAAICHICSNDTKHIEAPRIS